MSNEALYQERYALIERAINLEPVDRVPVLFMGAAFAPRYMGMSIAQYCTDPEAAMRVPVEAMDRLGGFDGANIPGGGGITYLESALWMSRVALPGRDLPPDSLWQVQEAEVLTVEDYDTILNQGWNAFVGQYLPRVVDMAEFGAAMGWNAANGGRIAQLYRDHGYVVVCDAPMIANIPFEPLCGGRSMAKFFLDLHRMPDKVEAVMKVVQSDTLATIQALDVPFGIGGSWIGGWRSASALLAPKLWDRFVWPYVVELVEALIAKGIRPVLHWDQDWTRDLGRLVELPAKKCILNPDGMTDVRKFKELAGDRMAMMGDIPASILAAGTPDDVYAYVRDLVRDFGSTGLLLCPGCDAPINTKPENMAAFVAASHEYGRVH